MTVINLLENLKRDGQSSKDYLLENINAPKRIQRCLLIELGKLQAIAKIHGGQNCSDRDMWSVLYALDRPHAKDIPEKEMKKAIVQIENIKF